MCSRSCYGNLLEYEYLFTVVDMGCHYTDNKYVHDLILSCQRFSNILTHRDMINNEYWTSETTKLIYELHLTNLGIIFSNNIFTKYLLNRNSI